METRTGKNVHVWCAIAMVCAGVFLLGCARGLPDNHISGLPPTHIFSGCSPESEINITDSYQVSGGSVESVIVREGVIYAGSSDGMFTIIDLKSGTIKNISLGSGINTLAISPAGDYIAAGLTNGSIYVFQTRDFSLRYPLFHGQTNVWSISFQRGVVVSGGGDRYVIFWDLTTGEKVSAVKASSSVRALSSRGNGDVAIGLYNGEVALINGTSHEISKLYEHSSVVRSIAWNENGSVLASVSSDKTLRIWDNGRISVINASTSGVFSVAWMGNRVITGGSDGHVKIWNTGSQVKDFRIGSSIHTVSAGMVKIIAGDIHGRVTLFQDTIPPKVVSTSLNNRSISSIDTRFTVRFSECIHAGNMSILPDGWLKDGSIISDNDTITGGLTLQEDTPDGEYHVFLTGIKDLAGNSIDTVDAGVFTLDRTPPEVIDITQSRPSPLPIGGTEFKIRFSERMQPGIDVTLIHGGSRYDGIHPEWSKNGITLTLTIYLTEDMPSGEYTIYLTAGEDIAGNIMNPVNHTFTYDGEPPVAVAGEDIVATPGSIVTLDGSNSTGASKFIWTIAGRNYPGKVIHHMFNIPEEYLVTLTVFDDAGNSDSDSLTVHIVDGDSPDISIEKPEKLINKSRVVIRYNITDTGGLSTLDVIAEGGSWQEVNQSSYNCVARIDDGAIVDLPYDGTYNISMRACDCSGHCSVAGPFDVTLDSTPPGLISHAVSPDGRLILTFSEDVVVKNILSTKTPEAITNAKNKVIIKLPDTIHQERYLTTLAVSDLAGNTNITQVSIEIMSNSEIVWSGAGFFSAGFTTGFLLIQFIRKHRIARKRHPARPSVLNKVENIEYAISDLRASLENRDTGELRSL